MSEKIELLPCPFCDTKSFQKTFDAKDKNGKDCSVYQHPEGACQLSRHLFLAEPWNTRAPIEMLFQKDAIEDEKAEMAAVNKAVESYRRQLAEKNGEIETLKEAERRSKADYARWIEEQRSEFETALTAERERTKSLEAGAKILEATITEILNSGAVGVTQTCIEGLAQYHYGEGSEHREKPTAGNQG